MKYIRQEVRSDACPLSVYSYFAWASPLPFYLLGQCESLNLWDGDESDSHAFPFYNLTYSISGESSGNKSNK